jgi:hypothetical protein
LLTLKSATKYSNQMQLKNNLTVKTSLTWFKSEIQAVKRLRIISALTITIVYHQRQRIDQLKKNLSLIDHLNFKLHIKGLD